MKQKDEEEVLICMCGYGTYVFAGEYIAESTSYTRCPSECITNVHRKLSFMLNMYTKLKICSSYVCGGRRVFGVGLRSRIISSQKIALYE